MKKNKKFEKQLERSIYNNVKKYGLHVQVVGIEEKAQADFAYSIGMVKTYQQPEIIMAGLPYDVMGRLINSIGELYKEGVVIEENKDYDDLLQDFPVRFKKVHPSHFADYVGWAMWFNNYQPFDVLQLFWPDKNGYFPWENQFNPLWIDLQPHLFLPKKQTF